MPDAGTGTGYLPIDAFILFAVTAVVILAACVTLAPAGERMWAAPPLLVSWMLMITVLGSWWSEVITTKGNIYGVVVGTICAITVFVFGSYRTLKEH